MFSMVLKFGLPALLFTITPEDSMNLRIKIMATNKQHIPIDTGNNDNVLLVFVIDCAEIRHAFPGLCAIDFENIIAITIEELIGWKPNGKKSNKGLFGDVIAYAMACEEQGRKTLHSHFLLWIKDWTNLLDGLGDITKREECSNILKQYTKSIMSTRMHEYISDKFECKTCNLKYDKCSDQCLRELRTAAGKTEFGNKAIMKCGNCGIAQSSVQTTMARLDMILGIGPKPELSPLLYDEMWSKSQQKSKYQVCMEIELLNSYKNEMIHDKKLFISQLIITIYAL